MSAPVHQQSFYAHGKLLLSGEYIVMDGALALALPCRFGQHLHLDRNAPPGQLNWESLDCHGRSWFSARFSIADFSLMDKDEGHSAEWLKTASALMQLLKSIRQLHHLFLLPDHEQPAANPTQQASEAGWTATTKLEFERNWGLGSSSTLVSLLAQWSGVDPFKLVFSSFGGSGYDVACARANGPLFYRKVNDQGRFQEVSFNPPFAGDLYFVHLGRKQDSAAAVREFQCKTSPVNSKDPAFQANKKRYVNTVIHLTTALCEAENLYDFEQLLQKHESVISAATGLQPIGETLFSDFWGTVKSLGAWGGDFVLATSEEGMVKTAAYFASKGLNTILPWQKMVLQKPNTNSVKEQDETTQINTTNDD